MDLARKRMPSQNRFAPGVLPHFWKNLLIVVAIGKASVGGAGAALAIAGALNIAAAVTAQHWLRDLERHYLDYFALGGGVVGAAVGTFTRFFARP